MGSALFYAATSPEGMLVGMVWVLVVAGVIVCGLILVTLGDALLKRLDRDSCEEGQSHDWRPQ